MTYDFQFDPAGAQLDLPGVHTVDTERETGSVAVTRAANLELGLHRAEDPLRRIDEADLAPADRALITRPVLLAYRYAGDRFTLTLNVKRYPEMPVLAAVADRTQLITVLNEAGELLTQASFMVKNNDKQYQRFKLPPGARLWSCHVDNQAVTPERDGDWVLVPLPRGAAPDKAFAVDIVYAESGPVLKHRRAGQLALTAPVTDVPNTYAEWELYVPPAFMLEDFTGNMTAVPGTVYTFGDAWRAFVEFYARVWRESGTVVAGVAVVLVLIALVCVSALRRGLRGAMLVLGVVALVLVLAIMLLPSLATAKRRAVAVVGLNNLKQIGMAIRQFASANTGRTPNTLEELAAYMGGDEHTVSRLLVDPQSGERFVYVAPGVMLEELAGDSVIAYSPVDVGGRRLVLFADGHAESVPSGQFEELARRGFVIYATEEEKARRAQADAIQRAAMGESRKRERAMPLPARGEIGGALAPAQPTAESTVSGVPAYVAQTTARAAPAPMTAGVRSIRIDVPRSGRAYVFTKVLNVYEEPLQIRADLVSLRSAQRMRAVLQAGAFLIGLGLCVWQWRKLERSSFWVAVGLALVLGAMLDLTIAHRTLHFWMIVAVPVALVIGMVLLLRLVWRRWGVPEEVAMPLLIATLTVAWPAGTGAQAITPEPAQVAITSATYTGTVNDRVAQVDAEFNLISHAAGSRVRLFGGDVVICGFDASAKGVRLVRDGANVDVFMPQKGEVRLRVRLLPNVGGKPGRRVLAFGIPDALASRLSMVVAEPGADVDVPGAVSVSRDATGQQTRVEALIGARERVELYWSPRVKRAEEVVATVTCRNSAVVSLGSGVVSVRSALDYQVLQGALRQLRVRLPVGHRLLRVEGESIRTWLVTNDSAPMLVVELSKAVAPAYRLVVETETGLGGLPGTVSVEIPHALDVRRESGVLALRVEEELDLTVQEARGLDRIDAEEFARVAGAGTTGLNGCFRFLAPDFTLRVGLAPVQPQIEAKVHNHVMVGAEQTTLTATVVYSVKRAGVFGFVLGLPAGSRVERVGAEKLLQWSEREVDGARVLEVAFKERVIGTRVLEVVLVQHYKELPAVVQVPGVHPWDVQKLSGFVSVSAEPGLVLRTRRFSGLTEIPVSALEPIAGADSGRAQRSRVPGGGLAFKFSVSEPGRALAWQLDLDTEVLEPWVRAEVANVLAFQEGLVTGRALVRFDIQNAPTKQFTVRVPVAFRNVAVTGPDVRRVDRNGDLWRVELQNKVRGEYRLNVTWDQPLTNTAEMLELRGISVESVERETGVVALVARPPLQVAPVAATELLRVDVREWPGWAGPAPEGMVLLYRYLRPGYGLTVNLQQFKPAEVLEAMVEQLDLGTVVSEDGQMMTYMQLAVRNTGRQFVEVALSEGSLCGWSAFVNGRAVRPGLRSGRLLIPLEPSSSDGAPVRVELTYVGTNKWPRTRGKVVFRSPVLDLPLKNARWVLYLPPDYRYRFVESGSTMKPEAGVAPERISFSLGEYMVREQMRMRSAAAALGSELATAKQKLARGQVREAYRDLSRVKGLAQTASVEDRSIKELDEELVRVQISNLQQAPLAVGAAGGAAQAGAPPAAARFDESAAIAQWHKLQQAQETAGSEILPLRANLPTHGLKYAFAQVLQTEPGKPVAVELRVKNLRAPCWIARVAGVCAGFIVLWALAALVVRPRLGSSTRATPPGATPS